MGYNERKKTKMSHLGWIRALIKYLYIIGCETK